MKHNPYQPFSLRAIVNELIACHAKSAKESLQIINNVSSDLTLISKIDPLTPLISDLLSILAQANNNQPVFVSAIKINGGYKLYAAGNSPAVFN